MTESAPSPVAGLDVSRETFDRLRAYEAFVQRWNPAINLVAKSTLGDFWSRHVLDSAQLLAFAPMSSVKWVDLGSGGGLPGLVIAILATELRPELKVVLVESDRRKATFLRQAAQSLGISVEVLAQRIESVEPQSADVLSARALAALSPLLGFASRHLKPDGTALFPKGEKYLEEVAEARKGWAFDVDARPSVSDGKAAILVIRNIHRVQD